MNLKTPVRLLVSAFLLFMKLIPLSKGKFAKVDDADFDWLSRWKWYFDGRYAAREEHVYNDPNRDSRKIYMHRLVNGTKPGVKTDHHNGDKLDNQRGNLRDSTNSQNVSNKRVRKDSKSGLKGVQWHSHNKLWVARITKDRRMTVIGYFKTKEEAARAYDRYALKLHGEFARLNNV